MIIIPGSVYGFHRPDLEIIGTGGGGSGDDGDISNNPNSKLKDKFFYIYSIIEEGNNRINVYSTDDPTSPNWNKSVIDASYFPSIPNVKRRFKITRMVYNKNNDSFLFCCMDEYSKHVYAIRTFDLINFESFIVYEYDEIIGNYPSRSLLDNLIYNPIIDKYILLINFNTEKSVVFDSNGYVSSFILKDLYTKLPLALNIGNHTTKSFDKYFIFGAIEQYKDELGKDTRDIGYSALSLNDMTVSTHLVENVGLKQLSFIYTNEKDNLIVYSAGFPYNLAYTKGINDNFIITQDTPFAPNWMIKYNKEYLFGLNKGAQKPLFTTKDFNTFEYEDFSLLKLTNNNLSIRKKDKLCIIPGISYLNTNHDAGSYDVGIFPNMTKTLTIENFESVPTYDVTSLQQTNIMNYDEQ